MSDGDLLQEADQRPEAFELLVERHRARLIRYATRRLGPSHAEDIVNETFAVAFAKRGSFDRARPDAGPWLLGIATNLIRRHARREAKDLRAFARTGVDPVSPDHSERTTGSVIDIAAVLAGLRPKYRDVLFLHAIADLSHEQIAEAMGISVVTARGWLHRARAQAAKELAARGITGPSQPSDPDLKAAES